MSAPEHAAADSSIHAVAFLVGEIGLLVTGRSGAGKSSLVMEVARLWREDPVRLVADDRVRLRIAGGRLIATPHAGFLGRIELRGFGIADCAAMPSMVARGVVELRPDPQPRMPDEPLQRADIAGISLPALRLRQGGGAASEFITKWPYFRDVMVQ